MEAQIESWALEVQIEFWRLGFSVTSWFGLPGQLVINPYRVRGSCMFFCTIWNQRKQFELKAPEVNTGLWKDAFIIVDGILQELP